MPRDPKAQADLARKNAHRDLLLAIKNLDKLYMNHGDQTAGKLSNLIQTAYNLAQFGGSTYQPQVQAYLNELVALADQKPLAYIEKPTNYGRCDTCGDPCDSQGCTTNRDHEIALV